MRRRIPIIIPLIILIAALFLGGNLLGRNNQRKGQNDINQQARNYIGLNLPGTRPDSDITRRNTTDIGTTPGAGYNGTRQQIRQQVGFDRQKADTIRTRLGDIDGIQQINTIVKGNTALIGYNPLGNATNANSTSKMITDRVKQLDNTITNVIVSGSADFSSRIRKLVDNINSGKPLDGLNTEFNQLIQNIRTGSL